MKAVSCVDPADQGRRRCLYLSQPQIWRCHRQGWGQGAAPQAGGRAGLCGAAHRAW